MISIFVHDHDLARWRWKADASSDEPVQPQPRRYGDEKARIGAAVRQSPIPSVILEPDDNDVASFIDWVRRTADASIVRGQMESFLQALRRKISICLPAVQVKDEPICVFIHFGGEFFLDANIRLGEAWSLLPQPLQDTFLCFAITVNGSRKAGINGDWQTDPGDGKGNILQLPSDVSGLKSVLDEGCRRWGREKCPDSFLKNTAPDSSLPRSEIAGSAKRASTPSPQDQSNTALPNPAPFEPHDSDANRMSNLHVFVIADKGMCGDSDERCQQWIDKQRACFEGSSYKSFDACVIPAWDGTMGAVRDAYHGIAGIVSAAIGTASPKERFIGVLDARKWPNMENKEDGMPSLKSVQGLLILAFPEVMWVPVFKNGEENSTRWLEKALGLIAGGFNPMFDGTGVRGTLIRNRKSTRHSYNRKDVAVTIDEERHFAELTAYTAFRFGYRAFPVSTERLAKQVLGAESPTELPSFAGAEVPSDASLVVFEDGDIEFPDSDQNDTHFFGTRRKGAWPLLGAAHLRVLATAADPEEQIAWSADKEDAKSATETPENAQTKQVTPNMTAREWFTEDQVEDLGGGKNNSFDDWFEKCRRGAFNLFAGGMGWVWSLELVKVLLLTVILGAILILCPGFLFLALFLVFVVFGFLRKAMSAILGRNARIRRDLQIRSQWRFYPKLYTNHVPVKEGILKGENRYWLFVQKPLGGIFGLRNQCGLPNGRGFSGQLDKEAVKTQYREALNPQKKKRAGAPGGASRHSASGMTLDIATDLIARARAMKDRGGGVEDALHAAVLATCAYELLDDKTPALSVEALELRHYCEVMAECEFPGIRAQLDMEDRLIDIHNSMSQICQLSEDGSVRAEMFESGMAAICDNLSELLRARGRYSEAAFMTRRARYMHRLLLPSLGRSFLAYPEWVIRSPWHCAISIVALVAAFFMYWMFQVNRDGSIPPTLGKTWEVLVCDEPDLSWPGRDKGVQYIVRQPSLQSSDVVIDWEYEVWPAKTPTTDTSTTKELPSPTDQNSSEHSDNVIPEETYSQFVHTMRQIALLHLAFLCAFFWDAMRQK